MQRSDELDEADIVILPGSKNTLDDLREIRRSGMAKAICRARRKGKTVVGICGGYQMMGEMVSDPCGVEGKIKCLPGLSLLPASTELTAEKTTRQVEFTILDDDRRCAGYEIHMGRTSSSCPFLTFTDGTAEGCMADERCFGSYVHGMLDNEAVIDFILKPYGNAAAGIDMDTGRFRDEQYDLLARWLREHIDIPQIYKILTSDD